MRWLGIFSLVLLGVYGCYWYMYDDFRFRITLEVEADGKIHTGSSVIGAQMHSTGPGVGMRSGRLIDTRGEAIVVDLGSRGLLFAILMRQEGRGQDLGSIVYDAMPPRGKEAAASPENVKRYARSREKLELPYNLIPMLVRFRDINDPKSVEKVDPGSLGAKFGPGVRLVRATLEMTQDPVTNQDIPKRLPWWSSFPAGSHLDGSRTVKSNAVAGTISRSDFSKGL